MSIYSSFFFIFFIISLSLSFLIITLKGIPGATTTWSLSCKYFGSFVLIATLFVLMKLSGLRLAPLCIVLCFLNKVFFPKKKYKTKLFKKKKEEVSYKKIKYKTTLKDQSISREEMWKRIRIRCIT